MERRNPPPQRRAPDRRPPPEGSRPGRRHTPAGVAPKGLVERTGPLHVEIIVVGRELLRGRTQEAIAGFLAGWLSQRGAIVHRITTVDDHDRAITEAMTEAIERGARLVITTGGLGPTSDDKTLAAVADALRLPLAIHPHAKEMVESAYRRLAQERRVSRPGLTAAREKMCSMPVGSEPVPNDAGTAPGVIVRRPGGVIVVCLPGVPEEARGVFLAAIERLRDVAPRGAVARREVETPTADESSLRTILDRLTEEFPQVWVKSHAPGFGHANDRILVTIEAGAATEAEATTAVENALRRLLSLSGGG